MDSRDHVPKSGETVLDYTERLTSDDVDEGSFASVVEHFGVSDLAAKSLWIASENFNTRFAFKQWSDRLSRSPKGYGARKWLQRKYRLTDAEAEQIDSEFRCGNRRALADKLSFEGFARVLLTVEAQDSLRHSGWFGRQR